MRIVYPSREFDQAVADACHGAASEEQLGALNLVLRESAAARDEYILRLEVHSRLASDPDLFAPAAASMEEVAALPLTVDFQKPAKSSKSKGPWIAALAACVAIAAVGLWAFQAFAPTPSSSGTSKAVAMLNRTVEPRWSAGMEVPKLNAPLEPGTLRLEAGLAQVIFYSGARLVIEGPAEVQLISQNEAICLQGRIIAEIPPQAGGFRIGTTHFSASGQAIGLRVKDKSSELHALEGVAKVKLEKDGRERTVQEGSGLMIQSSGGPTSISANRNLFASLFDLGQRSVEADARRLNQWRSACKRLEKDESLLVHFDFENVAASSWQIPNLGQLREEVANAAMVGCQWTDGRWQGKRALDFQTVNDRMRLFVPGEFQSLTLAAWVSVKGLDRKINSIFMSDGFEAGTIHWLIRRDGVLGLTVIDGNPKNHQIIMSPPVVTLDKLGMWLHLAVTLDTHTQRVVHYVNGIPVSEKPLKIPGPFRIGTAELGNWNAKGFPESDPFMIRNFSGAIDEFCFFNRPLSGGEIQALYRQGKPQGDPLTTP